MVHDSGARQGRPGRMRRRFPDADLVVFGHSHEPVDEVGDDGQRLFNPGSPTHRRRQPQSSYGVLEVADGHLTHHTIVRFDPSRRGHSELGGGSGGQRAREWLRRGRRCG